MPATITDILDQLRREYNHLGITLNPPIIEAELLAFEQVTGMRLPANLRDFYQCCNGFEVNNDLFRFVPLAENLEDGWNRLLMSTHDLFVAEYMIYSDAWALTVNDLSSAGYTIYNVREKFTLTTSFAEFLEVAVHHGVHSNGGLYDWEKRLAPPTSLLSASLDPIAVPTLPLPRRPWYKFW